MDEREKSLLFPWLQKNMNKLYGGKKNPSVYSEWSFVTTGPLSVYTGKNEQELILSENGLCHLCKRLESPW